MDLHLKHLVVSPWPRFGWSLGEFMFKSIRARWNTERDPRCGSARPGTWFKEPGSISRAPVRIYNMQLYTKLA